jgi:hypothetical protein
MPFGFMNRLRNGYGNIYTPHAGSMIIQVQRETGLANRTIIISERQVALVRVFGSRLGIVAAIVFVATWLLFAVQSVRVPLLSEKIAELEHDNRRIDSLQVALSRMHGRYEQVRQMLAATGGAPAKADVIAPTKSDVPNVARRAAETPTALPTVRDTTGTAIR